MLKAIKCYFAHHIDAAKSSFRAFWRKPLGTLMTTLVIAITLSLPILLWLLTYNVEQLTKNWNQGGQISLFLKAGLSESEQTKLLSKIRALNGVGQVTLKSSNEGLAELQAQEGMADIMNYLPENPLPTVMEVTPVPTMDTPAAIEGLYGELQVFPEVDLAKLDMQWVYRLHAILSLATEVVNGLLLLLGMAVVLIIGNTLRLAILNRYEEIQILKLIGASDSFIVRPFLYYGIWYGLSGALLAVCLVNVFLLGLKQPAEQLAAVYFMQYPISGLPARQTLLLVLSAAILGWLGARLSVTRQLASIEPFN